MGTAKDKTRITLTAIRGDAGNFWDEYNKHWIYFQCMGFGGRPHKYTCMFCGTRIDRGLHLDNTSGHACYTHADVSLVKGEV